MHYIASVTLKVTVFLGLLSVAIAFATLAPKTELPTDLPEPELGFAAMEFNCASDADCTALSTNGDVFQCIETICKLIVN